MLTAPLFLAGSNGHEFVFLLKGHEDLRQDERVMQLFGLVNTLLANDPTSLRKNLRYSEGCEHGKSLGGLLFSPTSVHKSMCFYKVSQKLGDWQKVINN
jgi:hypothetical protein